MTTDCQVNIWHGEAGCHMKTGRDRFFSQIVIWQQIVQVDLWEEEGVKDSFHRLTYDNRAWKILFTGRLTRLNEWSVFTGPSFPNPPHPIFYMPWLSNSKRTILNLTFTGSISSVSLKNLSNFYLLHTSNFFEIFQIYLHQIATFPSSCILITLHTHTKD